MKKKLAILLVILLALCGCTKRFTVEIADNNEESNQSEIIDNNDNEEDEEVIDEEDTEKEEKESQDNKKESKKATKSYVSNILCKPETEELQKIYEENKDKLIVDYDSLPKCKNLKINSGG